MQRPRFYLAFFLFGLLILGLTFYYAVLPAVSNYAKSWLREAGFEDVTFEIAWPGFSATKLSKVQFQHRKNNIVVDVRIGSLTLSYKLRDLFGGNIEGALFDDCNATVSIAESFLPPFEVRCIGSLTLKNSPKGWSLEPCAFGVSKSEIKKGEITALLPATSISLRKFLFAKGNLSLFGEFEMEDTAFSIANYEAPKLNLKNKFTLDAEQLNVDLSGSTQSFGTFLTGNLAHSLTSGQGQLTLQSAALNFNKLNTTLSALHPKWDLPFDITAGTLSSSVKIPWGDKELIMGALRALDVKVATKSVILGGLSGEIPFQYVEGQFVTSKPFMVSATLVDLAVPFSEVTATLQLTPKGVLAVQKVFAKVLGGEIVVASTALSAHKAEHSIPITLSGVQISEILKLYPQEQFLATGVLDGALLLQHKKEGFFITEGKLASAPPGGTIEYRATNLGGSQPEGLAAALNVLRDFRYTAIHASINFEPAGDLKLGLKLNGRNPTWQSGRPVELNINLDENVYELIRSMRLAKGQSDEIDDAVQRELERQGDEIHGHEIQK